MRRIPREVCIAVTGTFLVLIGSPVMASARASSDESHVVTDADLYDATAARASADAAARTTVLRVLHLPEVRTVAAQAGVDLHRAQAAVSVLSGEELREVTAQAQRVNQALAGGHDLIIISSTTIIIILLVLILIAI